MYIYHACTIANLLCIADPNLSTIIIPLCNKTTTFTKCHEHQYIDSGCDYVHTKFIDYCSSSTSTAGPNTNASGPNKRIVVSGSRIVVLVECGGVRHIKGRDLHSHGLDIRNLVIAQAAVTARFASILTASQGMISW